MIRRLLCLLVLCFGAIGPCTVAQIIPPDLYNNPPTTCWQQASDGNLYTAGYMFNTTTLVAPTAFPLPNCPFLQGTDGNFYAHGSSGLVKISLAGVATVLHQFTGLDGNGVSAMIQGVDGNFYGVSATGGVYSAGTLYRFTSEGGFTKLHDFTGGADGSGPQALVQGSDGNLYGLSNIFFKSTLNGTITPLNSNLTGGVPSQLIAGPNNLFYGITELYGGTVESFSTTGVVTPLANSTILDLQNPLQGPCFLDGYVDIICYNSQQDDLGDEDAVLLTAVSLGGGSSGFDFGGPDINSDATYSQAGNGNLYGVFSAFGNTECNDPCVPSDPNYLYGTNDFVPTPPISIYFSDPRLNPGQTATLTWKGNNTFGDTMQQCFASGSWAGIKPSTGTATITAPSTPGTYRYALTCGGVETNAALLQDGIPTITLASNISTFLIGTPLTLTAQVTGLAGATPTGTVEFVVDGVAIGSTVLNGSGVATLTVPTSGVGAGTYNVTAQYSGSATYASETSASLLLTLLATRYATQSELEQPSPSTVKSGVPLQLSGFVEPIGSNATYAPGTVTFAVGSLVLGTASYTGATVNVTVQTTGAPAGTYPITMSYAGNYEFAASVSNTVDVTVIAANAPSMTALATPAIVTPPATVTISAMVGGVSGQPAPTGTVSFYYSTLLLGTGTLNSSGVATYSTATAGLGAGVYDITANYSGDSNYVPDSATVAVTVQ